MGPIWEIISNLAQCGVDIFLLLSGFGLYYSYSNNQNYSAFIKKRFSVIVPPYLFVVIPYSVFICLIGVSTPLKALWDYSLISFYLDGNLNEWYIAAICALYLLFPLFYKITTKSKIYVAVSLLFLVTAVFVALSVDIKTIRIICEIVIVRIPCFILGIKLAQFETAGRNHKIPNIYFIATTVLCLLVGFCLHWFIKENYWTWLRIIFLPLSISACYTLSILRKKLNLKIDNIVCYLGTITLWLYLIHEKVLFILDAFFKKIGLMSLVYSFITNIIALLLSVGISWVLSRILQICFQRFKKHS